MLKPNAIYFAQTKKALHLSNNVTTINYNKKGAVALRERRMLQKKSQGLLSLLAVYVNGVFVWVLMSVNNVLCHQKNVTYAKIRVSHRTREENFGFGLEMSPPISYNEHTIVAEEKRGP